MCAIVDANVAHEVFGPKRSPAGEKFYDWIKKPGGGLVVGGKLLAELKKSSHFRRLASELEKAGLMRTVNKEKVDAKEKEIEAQCDSNDPHIIALAQVSGARLLYSCDKDLHEDFKKKDLIDQPPGKVYSTSQSKDFTPAHKKLLNRQDLC